MRGYDWYGFRPSLIETLRHAFSGDCPCQKAKGCQLSSWCWWCYYFATPKAGMLSTEMMRRKE